MTGKIPRSRGAPAPEFCKFQPREARISGCDAKQSGGVSVFLFATPYSPFAFKKGSGTPTNADPYPPHLAMRLALCKARSPVGVPPRLSPRGVVVPKARLRAKASWDLAGASGPVSSPQPGGADLAQFE